LNPSKYWLNTLATVNLIILLLVVIITISYRAFFRWYYFFMLFSSLSVFLKRVELGTILQIIGCFVLGVVFFSLMGIEMAFYNLTFWELLVNYPLDALEFYSFLGFCVLAIGLLIFEYRKYNAKKHQKMIS